MDKKTNVERIENMLYQICGCSPEEAIEVLNICLRNARGKTYNMTFRGGRLQPNSNRYKPDWLDLKSNYSDAVSSKDKKGSVTLK